MRAIRDVEDEPDIAAAARAALKLWEGLEQASAEAAALRSRLIRTILERGLMTRGELADHLGITPQRVSQLKRGPGRRR